MNATKDQALVILSADELAIIDIWAIQLRTFGDFRPDEEAVAKKIHANYEIAMGK